MAADSTTPRATARVQVHAGFTFDDARERLDYLERLGISHLFVSPILTARAGSQHGYDVIDHAAVNPELGGEDGLRRLVQALRERRMGLVVDVVPNHMAVGRGDNPRWLDVLEWGRDSRNATFFDIDWDRPDPALSQRVLTPFLGEPYGEALEQGRIALAFDADIGRFEVRYADHVFPLRPSHYRMLLGAVPALAERIDEASSRSRGEARDAAFAAARAELAQAYAGDAVVRDAISGALSRLDPAQPGGRALLHRLMERQHWRLAWWRTAGDEINWRRFFDVTELCAIRMQDRAVFEIVHGTLLRLYGDGLIDGLRIDHVDGLADPRGYCRQLRARLRRERPDHAAWVVVEKILAPGERLPADWQTDGTSGYTFMNEVGALLHDARGLERLSRFWQRQDGSAADFSEEEESARRRIPRELFGAEFEACAHALQTVARQSPETRDWTLAAIRRVLAELIAHFPVYRTYVDGRGRGEEDRRIMQRAVQAAERGCRPAERALLHRIDAWLGGEAPKDVRSATARRSRLRAIARFQQLTSPVAAKSVEDTAFYRHGLLLSRNEVGADPRQFSQSIDAFHATGADRRARYPRALLATATHDHKRGEDARARLSVISESADGWVEAVERWRRFNEPLHTQLDDGRTAPDAVDEYLLYQMMVGTWPLSAPDGSDHVERLGAWQLKALREAKRHSSWNAPDTAYEDACRRFLERALDPERRDAPFRESIESVVEEMAPTAAVKGLTQTLLRMTCPGIPDLYQGTDFWDLSMVDPDNRRPVDYDARVRALDDAASTSELIDEGRWRDGAIKQRLIARVLQCRKSDPGLFALGDYEPLALDGRLAQQFIAFVRRHRRHCVLVVAPLHVHPYLRRARNLRVPAQAVLDTAVLLPESLRAADWYDALEQRPLDSAAIGPGGRLLLARTLEAWPVAVLRGTG